MTYNFEPIKISRKFANKTSNSNYRVHLLLSIKRRFWYTGELAESKGSNMYSTSFSFLIAILDNWPVSGIVSTLELFKSKF